MTEPEPWRDSLIAAGALLFIAALFTFVAIIQ